MKPLYFWMMWKSRLVMDPRHRSSHWHQSPRNLPQIHSFPSIKSKKLNQKSPTGNGFNNNSCIENIHTFPQSSTNPPQSSRNITFIGFMTSDNFMAACRGHTGVSTPVFWSMDIEVSNGTQLDLKSYWISLRILLQPPPPPPSLLQVLNSLF